MENKMRGGNKNKNVRCPLSVHREQEARKQPSQLAARIAREKQAILALVYEQRQITMSRRVSCFLEHLIHIIEEQLEKRQAIVLHALWRLALEHHTTRVQRRRAIPARAHRQLWHWRHWWTWMWVTVLSVRRVR
jgi:hypothetical protein